jgi:hypothetical protein
VTLRLLKASPFYPEYLVQLYRKHPGLAEATYVEQYRALMADCFGWADFWKQNLEATGRYSVEEVVVNCEPLQKCWAREHGVSWSADGWALDILSAQLAEFRPDVFFAHDFDIITPAFRTSMRNRVPSIRLILGWDGIALNDAKWFAGCDVILSCADFVVDYYRSRGYKGWLFRHAFESSIPGRLSRTRADIPVSFVGGIALSSGGHNERLRWLAGLCRRYPVEVALSGLNGNVEHMVRRALRLVARGRFADLRDSFALHRHNRGPIFGLAMYQFLADSRIVLNRHIDAAAGRAGNMRLFEATGSGSCLLTDWKPNLGEFFDPEHEVVTFRSTEECMERIAWLLSHESERAAIAAAGQRRTLRDHSLSRRLLELDTWLGQEPWAVR